MFIFWIWLWKLLPATLICHAQILKGLLTCEPFFWTWHSGHWFCLAIRLCWLWWHCTDVAVMASLALLTLALMWLVIRTVLLASLAMLTLALMWQQSEHWLWLVIRLGWLCWHCTGVTVIRNHHCWLYWLHWHWLHWLCLHWRWCSGNQDTCAGWQWCGGNQDTGARLQWLALILVLQLEMYIHMTQLTIRKSCKPFENKIVLVYGQLYYYTMFSIFAIQNIMSIVFHAEHIRYAWTCESHGIYKGTTLQRYLNFAFDS